VSQREADAVAPKSRRDTIYARPGTSDEDALREVLIDCCYEERDLGFTVDEGETWLDLGANIGAFAIFCRRRSARAECFEPDPDCFALLQKNAPGFALHRAAVTNRHEPTLPFRKSPNPNNHWRATAADAPGLVEHPAGALPNLHGAFLKERTYDGVKMDIEGAEAGLILDGLLPRANKLVFEFHFSRLGRDLGLFFAVVDRLGDRFARTAYPASIDADRTGGTYTGDADSLVFAWEPL
jgi:FkbM family methyltransferase